MLRIFEDISVNPLAKNANVLSYQLMPTVKILKLCRNSTEKLCYGLKMLIVKREIELFREKIILYFTKDPAWER